MKYIKIIVILIFITLLTSNIFAFTLDDIFKPGESWYNALDKGNNEKGVLGNIVDFITVDLMPIIFTIGNVIIFIAGVVLGLKYVWSGVNEKAHMKETLPTYILGVIFFYFAGTIFNTSEDIIMELLNANSAEGVFGNIYSTIRVIVEWSSILLVMVLGLKYMMSSADVKAELKKSSLPVVLGIILIFSTTTVLKLIENTVEDIIMITSEVSNITTNSAKVKFNINESFAKDNKYKGTLKITGEFLNNSGFLEYVTKEIIIDNKSEYTFKNLIDSKMYNIKGIFKSEDSEISSSVSFTTLKDNTVINIEIKESFKKLDVSAKRGNNIISGDFYYCLFDDNLAAKKQLNSSNLETDIYNKTWSGNIYMYVYFYQNGTIKSKTKYIIKTPVIKVKNIENSIQGQITLNLEDIPKDNKIKEFNYYIDNKYVTTISKNSYIYSNLYESKRYKIYYEVIGENGIKYKSPELTIYTKINFDNIPDLKLTYDENNIYIGEEYFDKTTAEFKIKDTEYLVEFKFSDRVGYQKYNTCAATAGEIYNVSYRVVYGEGDNSYKNEIILDNQFKKPGLNNINVYPKINENYLVADPGSIFLTTEPPIWEIYDDANKKYISTSFIKRLENNKIKINELSYFNYKLKIIARVKTSYKGIEKELIYDTGVIDSTIPIISISTNSLDIGKDRFKVYFNINNKEDIYGVNYYIYDDLENLKLEGEASEKSSEKTITNLESGKSYIVRLEIILNNGQRKVVEKNITTLKESPKQHQTGHYEVN